MGYCHLEGGGGEFHAKNVNHTLTDLDEGKWPSLVKQAGLKIEREDPLERMGIFFFLKKIH